MHKRTGGSEQLPRVFVDNENAPQIVHSSGLYFRCFDLVQSIKRVEATGHKVVGLVYDGENSLEFLTDPPYEGDEFVLFSHNEDSIVAEEPLVRGD